jgi:hypothetical protein
MLLGGGLFGSPAGWILDTIAAALNKHRESGLDVVIVSYQRSNPESVELIERLLDEWA